MKKLFKKFKHLLLAVSVTHGVNSPTQLPDQTGNSGKYLTTDGDQPSWAAVSIPPSGVTSVGLSLPNIFTISNSPVTSTGTLTGTLATQAANMVWAGPTTGAAAEPTFRSLVTADMPSGTLNGSLTPTRIPYASDSDTLVDSANLVWDNTNNKVSVVFPGVGTTQKTSLLLTNSTAATAGNQQNSPGIQWQGRGWKTTATAASQSVDWFADVLPVQGTSAPSSRWRLRSSVNSGSLTDMMSIESQADGTAGYPRINLPGAVAVSIATGYNTDSVTFTNSNTGNGGLRFNYIFGSNSKAKTDVLSDGSILNYASDDFQWRINNLAMQLNANFLNIYSTALISDKTVVGDSTDSYAGKLAVNGSISAKSQIINSNTTISDSAVSSSIFYCDSTGWALCSGTPNACDTWTYSQCPSHAEAGCTQNTTGGCSDANNTDSGTCTGQDPVCSWASASCGTYDNDESGCNAAGFPSGGQCSWAAPTCSDFGGTEESCNAASGCSASPTGDCHEFDGNESSCNSTPNCSWADPSCSGSYYTGAGDCGGTYSGPDGTCSGSYDTGDCTGGDFGTCTGTSLCSNLTDDGSSACNAETGCSYSTNVNIYLPSISASGIKTNDVGPFIWLKKINSGAGSCIANRATGTVDTIEGSTSTTLSAQYSSVRLHPKYVLGDCEDFNNNRSGCEAAGCDFPECSDVAGEEACNNTNGCSWDGGSSMCTGTLGPNGTCSGTYTESATWYKW